MTTYKVPPIRLTADFSAETLQARRAWHDIFKVMKGKNLQPRLLYWQGSHSDSMEKSKLYRQAKAKRVQHHQTSSTTNAKGTSLSGKHKRRKEPTKTTQNNSENGHRNIHIDNYLKLEWIKCSNQKTQTC